MHVKDLEKRKKLNKVHSNTPHCHRKHCSWNASSVVTPLILWLLDITLCHHVTHLQIFTIEIKLTGSWKHDRAEHWHGEWCWLRRVWADQSEESVYSGGGSLKRQEHEQSVSDYYSSHDPQWIYETKSEQNTLPLICATLALMQRAICKVTSY